MQQIATLEKYQKSYDNICLNQFGQAELKKIISNKNVQVKVYAYKPIASKTNISGN